MIPDSKIPKCSNFEVKSKVGKLFMNEKIFEKNSVKIYEIDSYFYEHYKEKTNVDKNLESNTSHAKRGYDTDYEVNKIQIFISEEKK